MSGAATATATVRLLDQLSRPAQIIRNSLRGIVGDMNALKGARFGLDDQIKKASVRARELQATLAKIAATGGIGAYALYNAIKPGKEFETILLDIAQKADLSDAAMKKLGVSIKAMAPTVNRSSQEVAKGIDYLLGVGLDLQKALDISPAIGRTATAYRADIEDLSKASFAAIDNLKLPVDQLAKALDVMAQAGKEGAFELKDMATYFPVLTTQAKTLGLRGVDGIAKLSAAAQIARKGASDSASAATNVENFLQKIQGEEAVKRFRKAGIDIRKEIAKTQRAGGDIFETAVRLTKKATKGDAAKIGDLYGDAEVQKFLRPLIDQIDEYKRIRDKSAAASGVVDEDYGRRTKTFQAAVDRVSAAMQKLGIALGEALIPYMNIFADKIVAAANYLEGLISAFPHFTSAVVAATGALVTLAAIRTGIKLIGALAGLAGLKSIKGLLGYVSPKAKPGVEAAPKPSVGPAATEAATPRAMTPKEIASAKAGAEAIKGGGAAAAGGGVAKALKGGLRGGVAGIVATLVGDALIDKIIESLPGKALTSEQRAKADEKANQSVIDAIMELGRDLGIRHKDQRGPLDPSDFERSDRAAKVARRDPEAARGRAMGRVADTNDKIEQYNDPDARRGRAMAARDIVPQDGKAEGEKAGADLGEGLLSGFQAKAEQLPAKVRAAIAAARAELATANLSLEIKPRLSSFGPALRSNYADTGID